MNSFSKIVASALGAVVIAAGSAYAVIGSSNDAPTVRINYAVPYTAGFSNTTGWNCATSGNGGESALSFRDRWNGSWEFANNDFTSFTWATCQNSWYQGYLNLPRTQPNTVAENPRVRL